MNNFMESVIEEALDTMDKSAVFLNRDGSIRHIITWFMVNYHVENNLSHWKYFENELEFINPLFKRMFKFVNEVKLDKIQDSDKEEFKNIRFYMNDAIDSYKSLIKYFKSTSTIHLHMRNFITVYNQMLTQKLY